MNMNRRAFTLVELLVVIAIIAILVAILLPAVNAAREAARTAQCMNNLKQLGLAFNNYNSANGRFPPGWINNVDTRWDFAEFGWPVFILPFMEEQGIYDQLKVEERRLRERLVRRSCGNGKQWSFLW